MLAAQTRASEEIAEARASSIAAPHADAPIDPNGNLASDGLASYSWNARNQLVGLSGGTSASFAYDAFGRRAGKTIGGATTNFLYDRLNTVQELSGSTPTANLLTGDIDEVFQRAEAAGTAILLGDALGSTIALTDSTGLVQAGYTYSPFGETTTTGASASNPTQYTGREYDSATGLYYYRARYYSPSHARFASEDPLKPNDGWSLYVYGDDAPIDNSDPSGLFTTTRQRAGNTVVCDGKGGLKIQLLTIKDPCLIDCARQHELSHVIDIRSRNPSICVGQARGTGIAPSDDAERKWTEIRASQEEINCLKRKLKDNCGGNCRARIEARIKQMEQFRDSFK